MFPHSRRNRLAALASAGAVIALTAACSSGGSTAGNSSGPTAAETPSGTIKVVTWRTDLIQDGTFDKYAQQFEAKYPDVKVTFEGHTDYEGEVKTLMNTDDYGDVLGIINSITPAQLPDFFEPLGKQADLEQKYQFISSKSYDGTTYGIPVVVNAQGIVYNKTVWQKAGLTDLPKTPDELVQDLQKISSTQPDTVPLYTNYRTAGRSRSGRATSAR
jgi:ABC-type glycerol-3-phosphate transport system substrate-binding protein